jgi:adenylate cyclase
MKAKLQSTKVSFQKSVVTDHMVVIGFGLAAIYWALDSFLSIFLSYDNFLEKIFGLQLDAIWGRIIVFCLFAIFGSHAQFTLNERKKNALKMEHDAATRERFRRLFSPDLAEMVVNGKLAVEPGGEDRLVTVMFVDIRNFTALSRQVRSSDMLQLLNSYYEVLVDIVFRYEGTVDKFIGDGMMVLWGAPVTHADDADRAVKAAMDIQNAIRDFNQNQTGRFSMPVEAGIGINSGSVVAGYIGSSRTMSYSVIGDAVNDASRLCAAALPGEIVISEHTRAVVKEDLPFVGRPPVMAKGHGRPIAAYSIWVGKYARQIAGRDYDRSSTEIP